MFARKFLYLYIIIWLFPAYLYPIDIGERITDKVRGVDINGNIENIELKKPKILLSKNEIYHYEILNVYLYNIDKYVPNRFYMKVYNGNTICSSMGKVHSIPFLWEKDRLRASYMPDWNGKDGNYEIKIFYEDKRLKTNDIIKFTLKRRVPPKITEAISVIDLEMNKSLKNKTLLTPSYNYSDYTAIFDWAKFMNADALWILSGETTTFNRSGGKIGPWDSGPLENLYLLKEKAKENGIKIGAYIMTFYVPGTNGTTKRYESGIGYDSKNDLLYSTKHISLKCERRIVDIIDLTKEFQNDPEIHYIGFDFIRTGRVDGYELAEDVIRDTNIKTPDNWKYLGKEEKVKWFAKKIEVEKDQIIIEKWRWWRAHKVSLIVKRIIEEAEITKPVWVYTLGWNHGKEHGQDPVMFFDAGVDIDAVMLYEANELQFEKLLTQWNRYIEQGEGNIFVGNCVDYRLLDSLTLNPPGEF